MTSLGNILFKFKPLLAEIFDQAFEVNKRVLEFNDINKIKSTDSTVDTRKPEERKII